MVDNKEKNFVSAVLYVHNNEDQIIAFLTMLHRVLDHNFKKFEIICVNDFSTDGSIEKIRSFSSGKSGPMISIVNMSLFQGLELSMNAGVDLSIGDFVFEFDTLFLDYEENIIMDIYFQSLKGFDIVSAAPEKMKKVSSRLFYHLYNRHSGSAYKLRSENFRVLSRRAINRVHAISRTIPYRKALYANCGLKIYTLLYKSNQNININNNSKKEGDNKRDIAIDAFILFTDVAYKIALTLSIILLLFTVVSAIYTFVMFFGQHKPVAGWTTTMLLLSGGFFGVFLLLAIVIKYMSVLVDLVFKRQKYLIESIEKITR